MKIHQVVRTETPEYVVDPVEGVAMRMKVSMQPGGASVIAAGDHGTFEINPDDGAFDVPDELGLALLKQPGWFEGTNPFTSLLAKAAEAEQAPKATTRKSKAA